MIKPLLECPSCGSNDINKNGTTRHGNQNYKCRDCGRQFVENPKWRRISNGTTRHGNQNYKCCDCGRQFVENPKWRRISDETQATLERMLLEKIPLAGIARSLQVSESWLHLYLLVNAYYATVDQQVKVQPKPKQRLSVQMDELWSFVDDKGNEPWVWLALDVETREIVGCTIGDRSGESAKALWQSLPPVYRQCAVCYSDFWVSYPVALPSKRHRAVGKETGLTSDIERFNNTLRQRVSRLVRKTLSFSKDLNNHIAAIWNFIHHYNEQRRRAIASNQFNFPILS